MMVNACVTGILPGFRYVLLTDALIESLTPLRDRGGLRTRDRPYRPPPSPLFRLFLHGKPGRALGAGRDRRQVRSLDRAVGLAHALDTGDRERSGPGDRASGRSWDCTSGSSSATFPGGSSVRPTCSAARSFLAIWRIALRTSIWITTCHRRPFAARSRPLCPVGIRIFADALANVARCNGLDPAGRSWRHGSIANRIAFLEGLERHPEREDRFQRGVRRLRIGLGVVLVMAIVALVRHPTRRLAFAESRRRSSESAVAR